MDSTNDSLYAVFNGAVFSFDETAHPQWKPVRPFRIKVAWRFAKIARRIERLIGGY